MFGFYDRTELHLEVIGHRNISMWEAQRLKENFFFRFLSTKSGQIFLKFSFLALKSEKAVQFNLSKK